MKKDDAVKNINILSRETKVKDFINDAEIEARLSSKKGADGALLEEILAKSMAVETLTPDETAYLLNIKDPQLWERMGEVAHQIKKKVYDNRIVTFAPLYLSNLCVNDCAYCGFRSSNDCVKRGVLSLDDVRRETEVLAGEIGHKRLIVVYGEHPSSGADYISDTISTIYDVKMKTKTGYGNIRRVNVNAAPMSVDDLKKLHEVGIGTYQVFQETYHHKTYGDVHPSHTVKGDYLWRLSAMHRAFEAGIDDVGLGVLFGLYDWRFEVMGLLHHAIELEDKFAIGPHTVSFPRLEPAVNTPFAERSPYQVSDEDLKKLITVIRLAIPYTGIILTARESQNIRRAVLELGVTQTDASTKIGLGAYSDNDNADAQQKERQQFVLGDTRSLDEVIRELAQMGYITSFCTAGYRCGRTGKNIMELLRSGQEGKFCKLNAVITFREWLDDFASDQTKAVGEALIKKEIEEVKTIMPQAFEEFMNYYKKTAAGERDIYF